MEGWRLHGIAELGCIVYGKSGAMSHKYDGDMWALSGLDLGIWETDSDGNREDVLGEEDRGRCGA